MICQLYRYVNFHIQVHDKDHFKRHRQTEEKKSKYVMLRQDIECYPNIFGACSHKKDEFKIDECGGRLVIGNGGHGSKWHFGEAK